MADFIKINDLGQYLNMGAVWDKHPEGGREGDFLKIGSTQYVWDKYARQWVTASSTPGGASGSQVVDGDLSVNGDLNVSGDATVAGTLKVGDIQVEGGDRFKGQSSVTSFVFTRYAGVPPTPQGGTFDDPLPDGVLWKDSVPQGVLPIWMSKRIFTSDGKSPQQSAWSVPSLMSDDDTTDIEFSPASAASVPAAPDSTNRNGGSGQQIWFDPTLDPNAQWDRMNWMAIAPKSLDENGNEVWGDWTITLIKGEKGEDGDGVEHVFYRTKKFIQPIPYINSAAFQNDDYLPAVNNMNICEGDGRFFTDNPKGVNETWRYEWHMTRLKKNGVWQAFINGGQQNNPVLFANYSNEHDIYIGENGNWIIDGVDTGVAAAGTGVTVKGSVDWYDENEQGYTQGDKTLKSITLDDTITKEAGDCWIVGNGSTYGGHLMIYVDADEDWENCWQDLGEFKGGKGDAGESTYMYLGWATDVTFTDTDPQEVDTVTGFTTDPGDGQTRGWFGVLTSPTQIADLSAVKESFKWNYLKGRDGMDYEHVYIRTKVNTPPEMPANQTAAEGFDTAEYLPAVGNASSYSNGDIQATEGLNYIRFFDDPLGVSHEWPYEWISRREKINGHWQAFQSPAVLHRNFAESQPWVKSNLEVVTIAADSDGEIPTLRNVIIQAWLYVGQDDVGCVLNKCNATYYDYSRQSFRTITATITDGHAQWSIPFPANTQLFNGDITVNLGNNDYTNIEKVIPVVVTRNGAKGNDGDTGPAGPAGPMLRMRGEWLASTVYVYDNTFRDCVRHGGYFYMLANTHNGTTSEPGTNGSGWVDMGNTAFVATELLLAEKATISNLVADYLRTAITGPRVEMYGSTADFYGRLAKPSIKLTVDNDGVGCLTFYDKDGNPVIEVGPRGIVWIQSVIQERFSSESYYVKMQNDSTYDHSESASGQVQLHQFTARQVNGVIMGDNVYTDNNSSIAASANGKYFTATTIVSNHSLDNSKLANGLYRRVGDAIRQLSSVAKEGVEGIKAELIGYGLTQAQVNQFNWSLNNDPIPSLATPISIQDYCMFSGGVLSLRLAIWQGSTQFIVG